MPSTAKPNRSPALRSRFDVARRLLAEGEVLADHHLDDVQALDQQLVDVALGRELHEVRGERHDQEHVDAQFLDELGAAGQRGQLRRVAAREAPPPSGAGRTSSTRSARRATRPAFTAWLISSCVSAVYTVEHADRDDASAPVRGDLVLPPPALHSGKPTAPRSAASRSRYDPRDRGDSIA